MSIYAEMAAIWACHESRGGVHARLRLDAHAGFRSPQARVVGRGRVSWRVPAMTVSAHAASIGAVRSPRIPDVRFCGIMYQIHQNK